MKNYQKYLNKLLTEDILENYIHDGPLYRSMSLHAFWNILSKGYINNKSLEWNPFEKRKGVFFSTELNSHTISQGEEIERESSLIGREVKTDRRGYDIIKKGIINKRKSSEWSSIVVEIETDKKGTLYTGKDSGMMKTDGVMTDEVVFNNNTITTDDITKLYFVKNGKIVEEYTYKEFGTNKNKILDRFYDEDHQYPYSYKKYNKHLKKY